MTGQASNAARRGPAVNGAFGRGLVDDPHGFLQGLVGFLGALVDVLAGLLDDVAHAGFHHFVPKAPFFVLPRSLDGGFVIGQENSSRLSIIESFVRFLVFSRPRSRYRNGMDNRKRVVCQAKKNG
jgi:hypothetical protein